MKFYNPFKTIAIASLMSLALPFSVSADDETPLGEQMDTMSSAYKKLRKAKTTKEKVELMRTAQKATLKSLEYLPMIFKDIKDEAEKAKATADYKKLTGQLFVKWCELEIAFMAEDQDKADEIIGQIKDLKKEGHEKYTE